MVLLLLVVWRTSGPSRPSQWSLWPCPCPLWQSHSFGLGLCFFRGFHCQPPQPHPFIKTITILTVHYLYHSFLGGGGGGGGGGGVSTTTTATTTTTTTGFRCHAFYQAGTFDLVCLVWAIVTPTTGSFTRKHTEQNAARVQLSEFHSVGRLQT